MTNVQMLVHITGGRHDGTEWPYVGHAKPLKVSPAEAEDLYRAQLARPWPGGDEDERSPEPASQPQVITEVSPDEPELAPGVTESEPEPAAAQPEETGPPRPASSKAEWAEWARKNGASDEWIEAATKQQMMEQYGARP